MPYLPPSFFIIGERKCATSSLYRYLIGHPQILPCKVKEPQFFSKPWWYRLLNLSRYRALFPEITATEVKMEWLDLDGEGKIIKEELHFRHDPHTHVITGEASANSFAQVPPSRLYRVYPEARIILCLRHPVDRAFSHYNMLRRFAKEGRRIPFRPTEFLQDFEADMLRVEQGQQGYFAGLSFYSDRLKSWLDVFGKEQILIVQTEELEKPETAKIVLADLCRFLHVPVVDLSGVLNLKINQSQENELDSETRAALLAHYLEDIATLQLLTGRKFDWTQ